MTECDVCDRLAGIASCIYHGRRQRIACTLCAADDSDFEDQVSEPGTGRPAISPDQCTLRLCGQRRNQRRQLPNFEDQHVYRLGMSIIVERPPKDVTNVHGWSTIPQWVPAKLKRLMHRVFRNRQRTTSDMRLHTEEEHGHSLLCATVLRAIGLGKAVTCIGDMRIRQEFCAGAMRQVMYSSPSIEPGTLDHNERPDIHVIGRQASDKSEETTSSDAVSIR